MRIALAVVSVALLSVPLGSWAARAHTQTFGANLSLHFDRKTQDFNGHVGTSVFCHADRSVELVKVGTGVVGTTVSDHSGQWGPLPWTGPGSYYAQVTEIHEGGYGHDHICLAGTSATQSAP